MSLKSLHALLALALLIGCQSRGAAAEERYRMVERNNPSPETKCRAAREVADAYLQDKNEDQYRFWRVIADGSCMTAGMR